ncbi:DNA-binding protein [Candidatus Uhrbacteria bacterium]|nr:DNA-binding protein [Candidatus Uhrbacteria bacterium]
MQCLDTMRITPLPPEFLRLDRGEQVHETLISFCASRGIHAGWVQMIGAVAELELAFFDPKTKTYDALSLTEDLEIASCSGNVVLFEGKPFPHLHGVFGDRALRAWAGHVVRAVVGPTCAVVRTPFPGPARALRIADAATGLKLLTFSGCGAGGASP